MGGLIPPQLPLPKFKSSALLEPLRIPLLISIFSRFQKILCGFRSSPNTNDSNNNIVLEQVVIRPHATFYVNLCPQIRRMPISKQVSHKMRLATTRIPL